MLEVIPERIGMAIGLVKRKEKPISIVGRLRKPETLIIGAGVGTIGFIAWNRIPPEARARVGTLTEGAYQRLTVIAKTSVDKISLVKRR